MTRHAKRVQMLIALVVCLSGCATQSSVRKACREHGGVSAVSGNTFRKFVACRDGYYRTVR